MTTSLHIVLQTIDELLNELKIKYSGNGRTYLEDMLLMLYTTDKRLSCNELFDGVAAKYRTASRVNVARCIYKLFNSLDYSIPTAVRVFNLAEGETHITAKNGIYALWYELKRRLN